MNGYSAIDSNFVYILPGSKNAIQASLSPTSLSEQSTEKRLNGIVQPVFENNLNSSGFARLQRSATFLTSSVITPPSASITKADSSPDSAPMPKVHTKINPLVRSISIVNFDSPGAKNRSSYEKFSPASDSSGEEYPLIEQSINPRKRRPPAIHTNLGWGGDFRNTRTKLVRTTSDGSFSNSR